jgi:hypothetical protein
LTPLQVAVKRRRKDCLMLSSIVKQVKAAIKEKKMSEHQIGDTLKVCDKYLLEGFFDYDFV